MKNSILVVGTGTIGEPLIGLLADFKNRLKLSEIMFHKRTPLRDEVAKVESLVARGAKLVVDREQRDNFCALGHSPKYILADALARAKVIIDCTPAGNDNKEKRYGKYKNKLFIAQGSEKGFGMPYAYGINDKALEETTHRYVQVVSCNTHNICSILTSLSPNLDTILDADFVCIRRANDISQESGFIPSPVVGSHSSYNFGTHHAADASTVFNTLHKHLPLYSSAMKINSQYMHLLRFNLTLEGYFNIAKVIEMFRANKFVTLTHKQSTNKVFSFGRDHGYYGRIFNQTVVSIPTLNTMSVAGGTRVSGFCFTPQDGNSLLSSIAAALYGLYGKNYTTYMTHFDSLLYNEI